eukprot:1741184-Ditylum_brightwellii.AAC.1
MSHQTTMPTYIKSCGLSYSHDEEYHIVHPCKKHSPQCNSDWERILTEHNLKYGHQTCDVCSIRQKFSQMHRKKPGTGNPKISPHIQDAKLI